MWNDTYPTPEGFILPKPLVMPDMTDFNDLFFYERPWSFKTMNHHNGYAQPATPKDIEYPGAERSSFMTLDGNVLRFSRFCSVRHMPSRTAHLVPGWLDGCDSMMVTPKLETCEALLPQFGFSYTVGWEIIWHERNDRCLVVASQIELISSRYVAYVKPDTIPVPGVTFSLQPWPEKDEHIATHLLKTRVETGEAPAQCGSTGESTAEINDVSCPKCIEAHDRITQEV